MSDVKQYKTAAGKSPGELDSAVFALIAEGFQPYGAPYGEKEILFQAMTSGDAPPEPGEGGKPDNELPIPPTSGGTPDLPGQALPGGRPDRPDNSLPGETPDHPSGQPIPGEPDTPDNELPEHAAPKRRR